jgi:hypothetical protein
MAAPGVIGTRKTVALSTNASTQVLEAAVAGKIIEVVSFAVVHAAVGAVSDFESSAATVLASFSLGAGQGLAQAAGEDHEPLFWTAIGEGLSFKSTGAVAVSGYVTYRIVSV